MKKTVCCYVLITLIILVGRSKYILFILYNHLNTFINALIYFLSVWSYLLITLNILKLLELIYTDVFILWTIWMYLIIYFHTLEVCKAMCLSHEISL